MSNGYSRHQSADRGSSLWEKELPNVRNWIQNGFSDQKKGDDGKTIRGTIEFAEDFGKHLVVERLTTSQIRNIFGEVKRIYSQFLRKESADRQKIEKDFLMLRPRMAYAAKRAGRGIDALRLILDAAHVEVRISEDGGHKRFENFVDLFEAILAYHKAYGGRD